MHLLLSMALALFMLLPLFTFGTTLPSSTSDSTALLSTEKLLDLPDIPPSDPVKPFGHYLFVDAFNSAFPSINYELAVRPEMRSSYHLRISLGGMPDIYEREDLLRFGGWGMGVSRIGKRQIRKSEIGIGMLSLTEQYSSGFGYRTFQRTWSGIQAIVGYRWEWNSGAFFRAALSPTFFLDYPTYFFAPAGGLGFGWRISG